MIEIELNIASVGSVSSACCTLVTGAEMEVQRTQLCLSLNQRDGSKSGSFASIHKAIFFCRNSLSRDWIGAL